MNANPSFTNALIQETSPYLLQHAHNPVNWIPWSDTLFEQATQQNKPILLSIGYAACHWCHVMERESFESETVAEYMNAHFINVFTEFGVLMTQLNILYLLIKLMFMRNYRTHQQKPFHPFITISKTYEISFTQTYIYVGFDASKFCMICVGVNSVL
jgi:hypothetical protein